MRGKECRVLWVIPADPFSQLLPLKLSFIKNCNNIVNGSQRVYIYVHWILKKLRGLLSAVFPGSIIWMFIMISAMWQKVKQSNNHILTNTTHWNNAGLILALCLRRWPNNTPTLFQCVVFVGIQGPKRGVILRPKKLRLHTAPFYCIVQVENGLVVMTNM